MTSIRSASFFKRSTICFSATGAAIINRFGSSFLAHLESAIIVPPVAITSSTRIAVLQICFIQPGYVAKHTQIKFHYFSVQDFVSRISKGRTINDDKTE
jgi:hypothetical protein